jgi:carbohydrate diacid regulator
LSITNSSGIIVASSEEGRLGICLEVATQAIATRSEIRISEEDSGKVSATEGSARAPKAPAAASASEGIVLPLILRDNCAGALYVRGKAEELSVFASILSVAVISLLEAAEITHQDSSPQQLIDAWVKNLISSSGEDLEQSARQASILGIDCSKLSAVIVIRFSLVAYSDLPLLETAITELMNTGSGLHFLSYTGLGQYVCAVPVAAFKGEIELGETCLALARKLADLRVHFHIGVGRPNCGVQGYRQSYQDAFHSARVAERLGDAKRILYYNEQHIFRLLEGVPDYLRGIFIDNQTEGRSWDPVLLETLQTYFAMNCHVNETARALYIHRNTLLFRLNKIADIYNLDPRKFHDAVVLQVLLYLLQLSESGGKEE